MCFDCQYKDTIICSFELGLGPLMRSPVGLLGSGIWLDFSDNNILVKYTITVDPLLASLKCSDEKLYAKHSQTTVGTHRWVAGDLIRFFPNR